MITCSVYAPDGNLTCTLEAGHAAWHQADNSQWYGAEWNCDHWADTQAAPTQAATKPPTPPTRLIGHDTNPPVHTVNKTHSWAAAITTAGVILGSALLASITITATGTNLNINTPPPEARTDCAMQWVDAYPGHPLCENSPDRNIDGPALFAKYCIGVNERNTCNNKETGVPPVINNWPN